MGPRPSRWRCSRVSPRGGQRAMALQRAASTQVEAFTRRQEALQRRWLLPVGEPFTQEAWTMPKIRPCAACTSAATRAHAGPAAVPKVDPESQQAHLFLHIDTGPAYRFGPLVVEDGERYDPDGAPPPGTPAQRRRFSGVEMLDAQQRLASSRLLRRCVLQPGHQRPRRGRGCSVLPAASPITPDDAPVPSEVTAPCWPRCAKAPLQKSVFGLGVSTDSGARLSIASPLQPPAPGWAGAPPANWLWTKMPRCWSRNRCRCLTMPTGAALVSGSFRARSHRAATRSTACACALG